jgi:hypothetical protein
MLAELSAVDVVRPDRLGPILVLAEIAGTQRRRHAFTGLYCRGPQIVFTTAPI